MRFDNDGDGYGQTLTTLALVADIRDIVNIFRNILVAQGSGLKIVVDIVFPHNYGALAYKAWPRRMGDFPTQLCGTYEYIILGHLGGIFSRNLINSLSDYRYILSS